jgi:hypothetical protein
VAGTDWDRVQEIFFTSLCLKIYFIFAQISPRFCASQGRGPWSMSSSEDFNVCFFVVLNAAAFLRSESASAATGEKHWRWSKTGEPLDLKTSSDQKAVLSPCKARFVKSLIRIACPTL